MLLGQKYTGILIRADLVNTQAGLLFCISPFLMVKFFVLPRLHHISSGADISGVIPGFNSTVLTSLPQSMLLIEVESILMGFAFLAMVIVRHTHTHLQKHVSA